MGAIFPLPPKLLQQRLKERAESALPPDVQDLLEAFALAPVAPLSVSERGVGVLSRLLERFGGMRPAQGLRQALRGLEAEAADQLSLDALVGKQLRDVPEIALQAERQRRTQQLFDLAGLNLPEFAGNAPRQPLDARQMAELIGTGIGDLVSFLDIARDLGLMEDELVRRTLLRK